MEIVLLYFWLRLDALVNLFVAAQVSAALGSVVFIVAWLVNRDFYEETAAIAFRYAKRMFWFAFLPLTVAVVAIPSKTDVAILVGAHYAFKIGETPEAAKVMTLIRAKANDLLDEAIEEARKKPAKDEKK